MTASTGVSTLVEIGDLARTRPTLHDPPAVVAAWYEHKALLLHHIADETGDPEVERCGRLAHEHAVRLRRSSGLRMGARHVDQDGEAA